MTRSERLQIRILGVVQGVGFRPYVHRLARSLELCGWVRNDESGVALEVEGNRERLLSLLERLPSEKPSPALIFAMDHRFLAPVGFDDFPKPIRSGAIARRPTDTQTGIIER